MCAAFAFLCKVRDQRGLSFLHGGFKIVTVENKETRGIVEQCGGPNSLVIENLE